jgi:hypothetical protein
MEKQSLNHSADSRDPKDFVYDNLPSLEDQMLAEIEHRILLDSLSSTLIQSPDGFSDNAVSIVEEVVQKHGIGIDHPMVKTLVTKALALALLTLEKRKYKRSVQKQSTRSRDK